MDAEQGQMSLEADRNLMRGQGENVTHNHFVAGPSSGWPYLPNLHKQMSLVAILQEGTQPLRGFARLWDILARFGCTKDFNVNTKPGTLKFLANEPECFATVEAHG